MNLISLIFEYSMKDLDNLKVFGLFVQVFLLVIDPLVYINLLKIKKNYQ